MDMGYSAALRPAGGRAPLGGPVVLTALAVAALLGGCRGGSDGGNGDAGEVRGMQQQGREQTGSVGTPAEGLEVATFGAGCFWCVEAVLEQLDGVRDVRSGYMGGHVPDPGYKQVCTGETGHAEVVQVTFDPATISYETLLEWFWKLHDPTSLNRQGNDVGTQYRSVIFYHSEEQRRAAERSKKQAAGNFAEPIVTEITEAGPFYEAGKDHQDYYRRNPGAGYCRVVIAPKLDKLGLEK